MFALHNVTKVFETETKQKEKVHALRNISLSANPGELLVIVGPSGSGKTTLLRIVAGLEEPTSGSISIAGKPVDRLPAEQRDVAMVFQHYALFPHLTAAENISFGLRFRKTPRAEISTRVHDAAELLGLTACLTRYPKELSGGERQRVAVARAIVQKPLLFLFDEPLANLDAPMRLQMRRELARIQRRLGATTLYVTHDQVEAMSLGHRIAVIRDGVIQQVAPPLELYQRPANRFVAAFIGSPPMNFFMGKLVSEPQNSLAFQFDSPPCLSTHTGSLPLGTSLSTALAAHRTKPVILGLRPEAILVSDKESALTEPVPFIDAAIDLVEPIGSDIYLHLVSAEQSIIARIAATVIPQNVRTNVRCRFDLRQAHFFDAQTECRLI